MAKRARTKLGTKTRKRPVEPTKPRRSTTPFRSLDLPPKLKTRVYPEALTIHTASGKVHLVKSRTDGGTSRTKSVLALLQTCRQIRDEAEGLFYELNHLAISASKLGVAVAKTTAERVFRWDTGILGKMGLARIKCIKCIKALTVNLREKNAFSLLLSQLEHVSALEVLHLEVDCASAMKLDEALDRDSKEATVALRGVLKLREVRVVVASRCDQCQDRKAILEKRLEAPLREGPGLVGERRGQSGGAAKGMRLKIEKVRGKQSAFSQRVDQVRAMLCDTGCVARSLVKSYERA